MSEVKLKNNPDVWVTELLWAALQSAQPTSGPWFVAGDLNSSVTFDMWRGGPRGNQEILDRMEALGFVECLALANGGLVPTFRNPSDGKEIHQLDHIFVPRSMADRLSSCSTGDRDRVFGGGLSDHLPVLAVFEDG